MLKIIFPINIESEQSALKIITKDKSRKPLKKNKSFIDFIGKTNVIWDFIQMFVITKMASQFPERHLRLCFS